MTFAFYLAPVALRIADVHGRDAWVFAGTAIAGILSAAPAGRLADVWPRRRVIRAGLLLLAVAYAPLLVEPTFAGVLLATALTGTGLTLLIVAFQAYVADLLAARSMSGAYGQATAVAVVAAALGPLLAAALFARLDAPTALRASAAVFGLCALAAAALTVQLPAVGLAKRATRDRGRLLDAWRVERATIPPAAVGYVLVGAGSGMASPFFAVHFLDNLETSEAAWGLLLGVGTIASALGSLLVGRLGARIGPERVLVAPQAALALAALAFVAPLPFAALAIAYVARSVFQFTTGPTLGAIMMGRVAESSRGRAHAWATIAWNVGWASGAAFGGLALATLGGALFAVGGAVCLGGALVGAALLARAQKGPSASPPL